MPMGEPLFQVFDSIDRDWMRFPVPFGFGKEVERFVEVVFKNDCQHVFTRDEFLKKQQSDYFFVGFRMMVCL